MPRRSTRRATGKRWVIEKRGRKLALSRMVSLHFAVSPLVKAWLVRVAREHNPPVTVGAVVRTILARHYLNERAGVSRKETL